MSVGTKLLMACWWVLAVCDPAPAGMVPTARPSTGQDAACRRGPGRQVGKDAMLAALHGDWIVGGQIDGVATTLDLQARWSGARCRELRLRMTSRERDVAGRVRYGATARLGPTPDGAVYTAAWSDTFGGGSRRWSGIGRRHDDTIAFALKTSGRQARATFERDPYSESWNLVIDDEKSGWSTRFATLVLRRRMR